MSVNFKKNGNVTNIKFNEYKVLGDGSIWKLMNAIDLRNDKTCFTNAEVTKCIDKDNRFSVMGEVDNYKTSDGVYEFLLMYPDLSPTLYNRWSQTSSPNSDTQTGYTPISIAWSAHSKGIRLSGSSSNAVYDCDAGGSWWTPIGIKRLFTNSSIPGADSSQRYTCTFYVRIDNTPLMNSGKIYSDYSEFNNIIEY